MSTKTIINIDRIIADLRNEIRKLKYLYFNNSFTIEAVTKAQLLSKVNSSTLTPGQLYTISDFGNPGEGLFFKALTISVLEPEGTRIMLCPAYYGTGENNGDGNNWLGVWNTELTPAVNDLVIWGGLVWKNKTDNVGTSLSNLALDTTNWTLIEKSNYTNEYIPLRFFCSYDLVNDWIEHQRDAFGNEVGIPFYINEFDFNVVDITDWNIFTRGLFLNNKCSSGIYNNSNSGGIFNNTTGISGIYNNKNNGFISGNNTDEISNNSNNGQINNNTNLSGIIGNSNNGSISNNKNLGIIFENTNSGDIFDNRNQGAISGNSNTGDINDNNNLDFILNNSNLGKIEFNNNGGAITDCESGVNTCNISHNNNNGSISGTFTSDVSDIIVNKT